jgi:formate hydrogenlyase subunit 6/NADH:ubiquinone oxidoreductase subunit I
MKPLAMTKLSLKSLFKAPATVAYPAIPREYFPGTRGRILIEPSTCNLCVICDVRCPTKAIKVDRKGQTWTIDRLRCIQCGACIEACPRKCLTNENRYSDPVTAKETLTVPIPFVPPAPKPKPAAPAATTAPAPATTPENSDAKDGSV